MRIFFIIFHEHIPCTQSIKFFFCCKHHSTQQARICFICGYCIVVHHFFNGTSFIIYGVVFPLLMWEFTLHISLVQFFYGFILVPFLVLDSFHFIFRPVLFFTSFLGCIFVIGPPELILLSSTTRVLRVCMLSVILKVYLIIFKNNDYFGLIWKKKLNVVK